MLPDRVSNPVPLTCESGALPIALSGPAVLVVFSMAYCLKNKKIILTLCFWPGLGLPSQRPMLSYQKINPCQNIYGIKTRKSAKYCLPLRLKKRPVKITIYLGLDIIIKLKFTANFDRCAILNVLNCLTKNFES